MKIKTYLTFAFICPLLVSLTGILLIYFKATPDQHLEFDYDGSYEDYFTASFLSYFIISNIKYFLFINLTNWKHFNSLKIYFFFPEMILFTLGFLFFFGRHIDPSENLEEITNHQWILSYAGGALYSNWIFNKLKVNKY